MSKEILIGVAVASVAVLVGFLFFLPSSSSLKPINIGGVSVYEVPKSAVLEAIDSSSAQTIRELSKQGSLLVFDGLAEGVSGISSYDIAESDARDKLGRYLTTVNENFQEKVKGVLNSVNTASSDSDGNNKNQLSQFSTELFKSVSKSLSKSQQTGAKVIAKYYVNKGGVVEYHVLLFYNPQSAIAQLIAQEKLIEKTSSQSKELFTKINNIFGEAFKNTPMK